MLLAGGSTVVNSSFLMSFSHRLRVIVSTLSVLAGVFNYDCLVDGQTAFNHVETADGRTKSYFLDGNLVVAADNINKFLIILI